MFHAVDGPVVSTVVPCYNQGRFLPDALNSLITQSFSDWECIVINDGSSDTTDVIAAQFAARDRRFRYFYQKNSGLAAARNRGLAQARGHYIQFLDADDAIDGNKFHLQLKVLSKAQGPALCYSDYFSSIEESLLTSHETRYLPPQLFSNDPIDDLILKWETELSIPAHCFLFDGRLFRDANIRFNEQLPNHEDWDCWMNIFSIKPTIYYVDQKLAIYRIRSKSMCANDKLMLAGFLQAIKGQQQKYGREAREYSLLEQKLKITKKAYREKRLYVQYLRRIGRKLLRMAGR